MSTKKGGVKKQDDGSRRPQGNKSSKKKKRKGGNKRGKDKPKQSSSSEHTGTVRPPPKARIKETAPEHQPQTEEASGRGGRQGKKAGSPGVNSEQAAPPTSSMVKQANVPNVSLLKAESTVPNASRAAEHRETETDP